jgi:hypothetical protein
MPDQRRRIVPPKDARAEQVCLLDESMLAARAERPEAFFDAAREQRTLPNGAEFRFAAAPGVWERVAAFIDDERECCPFFAFEQFEDGDEVVLRITRPVEAQTT